MAPEVGPKSFRPQKQAPGGRTSISQNSAINNRPQHEALGIKYTVCAVYSPETRAELYCLQVNFEISKLVFRTRGDDLPQNFTPGIAFILSARGFRIPGLNVLHVHVHNTFCSIWYIFA